MRARLGAPRGALKLGEWGPTGGQQGATKLDNKCWKIQRPFRTSVRNDVRKGRWKRKTKGKKQAKPFPLKLTCSGQRGSGLAQKPDKKKSLYLITDKGRETSENPPDNWVSKLPGEVPIVEEDFTTTELVRGKRMDIMRKASYVLTTN